jgi:hypothetical protein
MFSHAPLFNGPRQVSNSGNVFKVETGTERETEGSIKRMKPLKGDIGRGIGLVALALLVLGLASCSDPIGKYMPLSLTNHWIYDVKMAGGGQRKVMEQIVRRQDDKYTLNNHEVLLYLPRQALMNKQGVMILDNNFTLGHQWVDNQMEFEVTARNQEVTVPAGVFKETVEITWTTKYPGSVDITAGTPPTLEPGEHPRVFIYTTTYAKGVGKIRETYVSILPDGTRTVEFVAELLEYHLRRRGEKRKAG